MAQGRTIDYLCYRIVGNPGDIGMALPALDESVDAFVVKEFINVIIPPFAVFIDSANEPMFVAHKAIFYIRRFGPGAERQTNEYACRRQQCGYKSICYHYLYRVGKSISS